MNYHQEQIDRAERIKKALAYATKDISEETIKAIMYWQNYHSQDEDEEDEDTTEA